MKIFINAGHCVGVDAGACGYGLQEAQVALKVGNRVADYLRAVGYEVKVFQFDGLHTICNVANCWAADLFVSIHCNSAPTNSARGTETFYSGSLEGKKLATAIQNRIIKTIGTIDRGIKTANYTVLVFTDMPAVLVEMAFINNADDAKLLAEREDDFARAIACGITDYVGGLAQ